MGEVANNLNVWVELKSTTCYSCGVAFGMSSGFYADRQRDHRDFYCPSGHPQHFIGETEADRLKRRLEAETARAESLLRQRERRDRQLSAARGRITKIKNRVAAGVCPCCSRTFENLGRHMTSKHPGYAGQDIG